MLGWSTSGCCGRGVSGAIVSLLVTAGGCREFISGPFIQSHCNTEKLPFWRQFCAVFVFEFRELGGVVVSMTRDLRGSTMAPTRGAPTGGYEVRLGSEKGHTQAVPLRGDTRFAWAPKKGTHKGCPYGLVRGRTGLLCFLWLDSGEGRDFWRDTLHVFWLAVV